MNPLSCMLIGYLNVFNKCYYLVREVLDESIVMHVLDGLDRLLRLVVPIPCREGVFGVYIGVFRGCVRVYI